MSLHQSMSHTKNINTNSESSQQKHTDFQNRRSKKDRIWMTITSFNSFAVSHVYALYTSVSHLCSSSYFSFTFVQYILQFCSYAAQQVEHQPPKFLDHGIVFRNSFTFMQFTLQFHFYAAYQYQHQALKFLDHSIVFPRHGRQQMRLEKHLRNLKS